MESYEAPNRFVLLAASLAMMLAFAAMSFAVPAAAQEPAVPEPGAGADQYPDVVEEPAGPETDQYSEGDLEPTIGDATTVIPIQQIRQISVEAAKRAIAGGGDAPADGAAAYVEALKVAREAGAAEPDAHVIATRAVAAASENPENPDEIVVLPATGGATSGAPGPGSGLMPSLLPVVVPALVCGLLARRLFLR